MLKIKKTVFLPLLVIAVTFTSVNQWSAIPIGNTTIIWIIDFLTIDCLLRYKKLYFRPSNQKDYRVVYLYVVWMLIGVVRGIFVMENYWEWKQLITGSLALSLPIFVYVFSIPDILQKILRLWIKIAIPAFFLFFLWMLDADGYHFYLGPVLLLACFLPILPKKWKIIIVGLLLIMIIADISARSQVIKAAIALLISVTYLLSKYITNRFLYIIHWLCYIAPVVLLVLWILGIFNLFQSSYEKSQGKYIRQITVKGRLQEENLLNDSRTFIYEEVIESAVRHHYILQGRTPARGNDSQSFGVHLAEDLGTHKYERHSNEVCHSNVFTWLGLIGVVLYSLIYLKSSYLAVYKSQNLWIKLLGIYIAFRWAYGWVEDANNFNIMNISLWMMIAMGFSAQFRKMNNKEFQKFIIDIFK
jgi:hypothetical protein